MLADFFTARRFFSFYLLLFLFVLPWPTFAQHGKNPPQGWHLMGYARDSVYGTGVNLAYKELLKGKKSQQVIVAVIDGGVDTAHEDLRGQIWTNPGEVPGNGIDDDHNGYADDIHGWDFLGGKDGRYITKESAESDREYFLLKPLFADRTDTSGLDASKKKEFAVWQSVKKEHQSTLLDESQTIFELTRTLSVLDQTGKDLEQATGKDTVFQKDLEALRPRDSVAAKAVDAGRQIFSQFQVPPEMSMEQFVSEGHEYLDSMKTKLQFCMEPEAMRKEIVRDNPYDISNTDYGNNNIAAGTPVHGTHVAGIIGAVRGNGKGMDGIADNVLIMPLRVVPDGDERDKDIALAIRYAVNNGARVINMSFGKYYSPNKNWVDEAVEYAGEKDVLLVDAAGNESKDLGKAPHFPNSDLENEHKKAPNYITVGASTAGPDSLVAAPFSNYGINDVDLFAPGVEIYSTVPYNQYASFSGTSMAAPVVTGIAALIMEYYPELSARQVKFVLEQSVMKLPTLQVVIPGGERKVKFSSLSKTGGIVNAYGALKLAASLKGERKP